MKKCMSYSRCFVIKILSTCTFFFLKQIYFLFELIPCIFIITLLISSFENLIENVSFDLHVLCMKARSISNNCFFQENYLQFLWSMHMNITHLQITHDTIFSIHWLKNQFSRKKIFFPNLYILFSLIYHKNFKYTHFSKKK